MCSERPVPFLGLWSRLRHPGHRARAGLCIAALVCSAAAAASPRGGVPGAAAAPGCQSTPVQKPTFRASAELVVVDVTVLGRDGVPVKDLGAADFAVSVDGQPRRIASLKFIDESSRTAPAASVLPVVSSNAAGGGGRLVLIVVDEATIRFGGVRAAMESIDRLLAGFGPSDRVALATLPGPRMVVEFGIDRQRIVAAVKKIPGGAGPAQMTSGVRVSVAEAFAIDRSDSQTYQSVVARECQAVQKSALDLQACENEVQMVQRQVLNQARNQALEFTGGLRSLLRALQAFDVPKVVILFSEGLVSPEAPSELAPLAYDAAAARAVIYPMRLDRVMFDTSDLSPTTFFEDQTMGRASLETLAGGSRGTMLEIVGSSQLPFERLAREVSGYYLLGIEPEESDRDGKPHRIQVTTGRAGLTVRSRSGFSFAPVKAAAVDASKLLAETLQSPAIATGVPLRATTAIMADEDPRKVRVMVLAEIDRDQEKGGSAQIGYAIYDDRGKVLAGGTEKADLQKTPSGALAYISVAAVPEGSYTVKLAAVREGRAGSVEHPFAASLTRASPFRLGDLLVRNPVARGERFVPSLDPVVSGDTIMGFVQMRADRDVPRDAVFTFEIAKEERGPGLVSAPASVSASRTSVRTVQSMVDARLLPPGQYGARLAVSVAGKPAGSVFTRFSLERTARAAGSPAGSVRTADIAPFQLVDVLAPAALGPFLDDLAAGASVDVAAALQKAREGKFLEAAQQLKPDGANDPRAPFIRGLSLLGAGQIQAASDAFRAAMRADPEFLLGAFFIGTCYAAGGKPQQAINAWQTSLVSLDRFPLVYRVLSDALMRNGQPDRAVDLLEEALGRWPDDEALRTRMVRAAFDTGRYEQVWDGVDRIAGQRQVEPAMLFMAMDAVLQAVIDGGDERAGALLARLERYRDLYAAAGGQQQPLVAEWVSFVQRKVKQ